MPVRRMMNCTSNAKQKEPFLIYWVPGGLAHQSQSIDRLATDVSLLLFFICPKSTSWPLHLCVPSRSTEHDVMDVRLWQSRARKLTATHHYHFHHKCSFFPPPNFFFFFLPIFLLFSPSPFFSMVFFDFSLEVTDFFLPSSPFVDRFRIVVSWKYI